MSNEENLEKQPAVDVTDDAGQLHEELTELTEDHVQDLQVKLEDALHKADEYYDQLLRTKAEMDNLRKRSQREVENAHKYAMEKFVTEMLPVVDSMELGLEAAKGASDIDKILEGTELTLKMLQTVLEKFEITKVNPEGEAFDPELHQAMSMQESADVKPNTVLGVMQKGYTLSGRLIRPAMVMVSKAPANAETENQSE